MKVSRTMSTQHPDNVNPPFFAQSEIVGGDDEVKEAFYAFSHLGSDEQLWDCEGKEVDNFVIKKLFSNYDNYFRKNILGKDKFVTIRVPNPEVERCEAKIMLESLDSIPRSADIGKLFYGEDRAPIFEVVQPMTTNARSLIRISRYYKDMVVGKQETTLIKDDIPISEWIGRFRPEKINVIPLIEDDKGMINADNIIKEYIESEKVEGHQRVWLARSDPALNYSSAGAVLLNKISLMKLYDLQEKISVEIPPILGCGSAPFRGNLKPINIDNNLRGYPSVQTFTIQSAFKYDYPIKDVISGIEKLKETKRGKPVIVDEEKCVELVDKLKKRYQEEIKLLHERINDMSRFVPGRRKRKLHIGLFGYARSSGGIKLPRAIKFCAALYSLGLPPEVLGLSALSSSEIDYLRSIDRSFDEDIRDSLQFLNKDNMKYFPNEIQENVKKVTSLFELEIDRKHEKITSIIMDNYRKKNESVLGEDILRAGWVRGFLG